MTDMLAAPVKIAEGVLDKGKSVFTEVLWLLGGATVIGLMTVYVMPLLTKYVPQLANWELELELILSLALAVVFATMWKNEIALKLAIGASIASMLLVVVKWASKLFGVNLTLNSGILSATGIGSVS